MHTPRQYIPWKLFRKMSYRIFALLTKTKDIDDTVLCKEFGHEIPASLQYNAD